MKYQEWEQSTIEKMHLKVLEKANDILDDAKHGEDLTSSDMDNLCHCASILEKIHHLQKD